MLECVDWWLERVKISEWLSGMSCWQDSFGLRKRDQSGLDHEVDVCVYGRRETSGDYGYSWVEEWSRFWQ